MKNIENFTQRIEEYIENNKGALLNHLCDLIRQPSISSTGEGVEDCCQLVVQKMEDIGIETTVFPTKPYPTIVGKYGSDPAKKNILVYAHYDVQPVGKRELWRSNPFEPIIVEGKMYGRGTADNKGPLMAHLLATEFWIKEFGELPVNLKFIFEGCEENGSIGLPEFLEQNRELLHADMVYFSDGAKNANDQPIIALGVKGMLAVQLNLTTMDKDIHSQYAPVLPSAAWQMVELLGKLRVNGKVAIPGFYDDIVPATEKENEILNNLPNVDEDIKKNYGAYPIYDEETGFYATLNNLPTFNIAGLSSGYTGEGGATVLTSKAMAKIDMRLVIQQSGEKILASLRQYIKDLGYNNVEIDEMGITDPAKTPVDTPFLPVVERAVKEVYGPYMVYPNRPSTAPDYLWTNILKLPTIQVRWCDFDSDNHAPNEKLSVTNYLKGIQMTATAFKELGRMK